MEFSESSISQESIKPQVAAEKTTTPPVETIERAFKSASAEARRKMAEAAGKFYDGFLSTLLDPGTEEEKFRKVYQTVDSLPHHMRRLYAKGVDWFEEELEWNTLLLSRVRGHEAEALLKSAISRNFEGKPNLEVADKIQSQLEIVTQHLQAVRYFEPTEGILIIEAPPAIFDLVKSKLPFDATSAVGIYFNRGERFLEPTFIVLDQQHIAKISEWGREAISRHELHHLVWDYLTETGFARPVKEKTPERAKAFASFRNELAAYVNQGLDTVADLGNEAFIYKSDDQEIQDETTLTRQFAALCAEVTAKSSNYDSSIFLYPIMTSENFGDLRKRMAEMVPVDPEKPEQLLAVAFEAWRSLDQIYRPTRGQIVSSMVELFKLKEIEVSPELLRGLSVDLIQSRKMRDLLDIYYTLEDLGRFAQSFGQEAQGSANLKAAISARLPLPKETVEILLGLPRTQAWEVPLDLGGTQFLSELFLRSFTSSGVSVDLPKIVDSSAEMRAIFESARPEIIANLAKRHRGDTRGAFYQAEKENIENDIKSWTGYVESL